MSSGIYIRSFAEPAWETLESEESSEGASGKHYDEDETTKDPGRFNHRDRYGKVLLVGQLVNVLPGDDVEANNRVAAAPRIKVNGFLRNHVLLMLGQRNNIMQVLPENIEIIHIENQASKENDRQIAALKQIVEREKGGQIVVRESGRQEEGDR